MKHLVTASLVYALLVALPLHAQVQTERDKAVRQDKQQLIQDEFWIYDNFQRAREEAVRSKKPLLIVFR